MTTTIILGIIAPFLTEMVTAFNLKLRGTLFAGDAAYILSALVAVVLSVGQVVLNPSFSWSSVATYSQFLVTASVIWTLSQGFYKALIKYPGMDVKVGSMVVTPIDTTTNITAQSNVTVSDTSSSDPVMGV